MEFKCSPKVDVPFVQNNERQPTCTHRIWFCDLDLHYCEKNDKICRDEMNCIYRSE